MPKGGLPGFLPVGDKISTVLHDYDRPAFAQLGSLGQLDGCDSLPELLCQIRRRCEGVEAIDLEKFFRELGGRPGDTRSTNGTIEVSNARSNANRIK